MCLSDYFREMQVDTIHTTTIDRLQHTNLTISQRHRDIPCQNNRNLLSICLATNGAYYHLWLLLLGDSFLEVGFAQGFGFASGRFAVSSLGTGHCNDTSFATCKCGRVVEGSGWKVEVSRCALDTNVIFTLIIYVLVPIVSRMRSLMSPMSHVRTY